MNKFYLGIFLCLFSSLAFSQKQDSILVPSEKSFYDMSIEELINLKASGVPSELEEVINSLISVASKKSLSTRESPSIVSLITEEEIKKMGARDLIDVLRMVPGFDFGVDVQGTVGIGVRGNWAHEGKVLLLIDGVEMNEILYSTLQFGNHYPIENIKRIEIIRGPGSAMYGGFAEYGVVNIITKSGEDLDGISVNGIYGQMKETFARRNFSIAGGKNIKGVDVSASGIIGQGNRSDQTYTDFYGNSYDMSEVSSLNPSMLNVGLSYKGLSIRGIYEGYNTTTKDGYGDVTMKEYPNNFNSYYLNLNYDYRPNEKLTITPSIKYTLQTPWNFNGIVEGEDVYPIYNKSAQRAKANLTANYKISRKINVVGGGEFFEDKSVDHNEESFLINPADSTYSDKVIYNNFAVFAEGTFKHRLANLVLGGRYDKHNKFGAAFNPRIGLTKKIRRFHFKALYAKSFRAPGIENINLANQPIKPERTDVVEVEFGYQLTKKMILSANLFDITTNNPIVYYVGNDEEYYRNEKRSGTQGLEIEYRVRDSWGYLTLNYSYYSAINKRKVATFQVNENANSLMGIANNKLNLNSSINIGKTFTLNPSLNFIGSRYAYTSVSEDEPQLEKLSPELLANLFFNKSNLLCKGLNAGIGVYDILNQKYKFVQPYNGGHAPLPGPSREFVLKLSYNLHF